MTHIFNCLLRLSRNDLDERIDARGHRANYKFKYYLNEYVVAKAEVGLNLLFTAGGEQIDRLKKLILDEIIIEVRKHDVDGLVDLLTEFGYDELVTIFDGIVKYHLSRMIDNAVLEARSSPVARGLSSRVRPHAVHISK